MRKMTVAGLATLMAVSALVTRADEFPGLAIGQTVRVTKMPILQAGDATQNAQPLQGLPGRFKAEVVAMDEDSISISTVADGDPIVVPRSMIQKLEVSRGRSRSKGAALGLGVGLAIGAIVGLASGDDEECPVNDPTVVDCTKTGGNSAGTDALVGAAAGAIVGALIGVPRWESIEHGPAKVALTFPRRGVGARVSFSW